MRALVFSNLYPNSVMPQFGLFVARRAESLAQRGLDVRVVSPVPYFPRILPTSRWSLYARVPEQERVANLPVTHPRYPHLPIIGMYMQAWNLRRAVLPHVQRLRRDFPFDFIDAHYMYPDGVAAVHMARQLEVPCVLTARGSDINLLPRYRYVRGQIVRALERADAIVAVSAALAHKMIALGAPRDRTHVIPNGIDRQRFYYGDPGRAREKLGLAADGHVLLSVGNLNELKGHLLMIEALARLRGQGLNASLHLFGEGEERRNLDRKVTELGLQEQVVLHGNVANEELVTWYQAATLFVMASSREGWPNVLNEALACGLPVAATCVGGVPEIVTHGENGILSAARSVESIADAIAAGLLRSWNRKQLSEKASRYDWSQVADRLVDVYAAMLGCSAPPRPVSSTESVALETSG